MRAAAWAVLCVAACGGGGDARVDGASRFEAELARGLAAQLGVAVERVRCPAGAAAGACTAEVGGVDGGLRLAVTEAGDGALTWRLAEFVVATAPVAARVAAELRGLGLPDDGVDCGPALVRTAPGQRLRCALRLPAGDGLALVTIRDDQARFSVELAVSPQAAAARTTPVPLDDLLRRSRALDSADALDGEADGEDGDDAGGEADLPVTPPVRQRSDDAL